MASMGVIARQWSSAHRLHCALGHDVDDVQRRVDEPVEGERREEQLFVSTC